MRRAARVASTAAVGLVAALSVAVGAGPAAAHNVVVDTTPGADTSVSEAPTEVSVTFDDLVLSLGEDGASTVVQVTDADGQEHATGCPATQDRTVSVPVSIDDAGEYTVAWRIVSADGHPTSGEFSFTYSPADDAGAAAGGGAPGTDGDAQAGSESGTDCAPGGGPAADGTSSAAGAQDTGAEETGSRDLLVVLGIAGAVVLLAGGGVLVALRVGRRRD